MASGEGSPDYVNHLYTDCSGDLWPLLLAFVLNAAGMGVSPRTLADALEGGENEPALFPVGRSSSISRGQLRSAVYELASTLQQSGIRKGDVVSLAEANTVRHAPEVSFWARAGAVSREMPEK